MNFTSALRVVNPLALSAAALLALTAISHAATVTADGFKLRVDGNLFVVKGCNYSPVPIGTNPGQAPYGDYFVKQFDNVWKPDIDKMRAADVNVIKLYAGDPALNAGAPGSAGNWKPFLDYCYNKGKNPIYVVMMSFMTGPNIAAGGAAYSQYVTDYTNMVKSTATHPAIFGYLLGNEIFEGMTDNPAFWTNFGALFDAARAAGQTQGKNVFLATAIKDDYKPATQWPAILKGEQSGKLGNLNSWMINVYRGPNMGGPSDLVFPQYKDLMASLNKVRPLIIGEWGTPHTTRPVGVYGQNATTPIRNLDDVPQTQMGSGKPYFAAMPVSQFLTAEWTAIKSNLSGGIHQVCAGGFIFGWADEYYKGGNDNAQVGDLKFDGVAWAGGYPDEAGFGLTSAVDKSKYGKAAPITRTFFKGYKAMNTLYGQSSQNGGELYKP